MNTPHSNIVNFTEDAFQLSSFQVVVKVWLNGSGQASFDLSVTNGVAELKLGFKLGHPADLHCDLPPPTQDNHHVNQDQDLDLDPQFVHHHRRRRRGDARRERDRVRAERHQAGLQKQTPNAETPALILPFTGQLLPVNKLPSHTNFSSPRTAAPAATPDVAAAKPVAATPVKASKEKRRSVDVGLTKKQLFTTTAPNSSSTSSSQAPLSSAASVVKKKYRMQEDDLWSKLFS